jgi:hypothetical protein
LFEEIESVLKDRFGDSKKIFEEVREDYQNAYYIDIFENFTDEKNIYNPF